jgi:hypothetical protein
MYKNWFFYTKSDIGYGLWAQAKIFFVTYRIVYVYGINVNMLYTTVYVLHGYHADEKSPSSYSWQDKMGMGNT